MPTVATVPRYEVMIVVDSDLDTESVEAFIDRVAKLIKDNKGRVQGVDKWGRRKLAYEIKHKNEGFYAVLTFEGTTDTVNELQRVLKISDDVLRHMVVRLIEHVEADKD